MASCHTHATLCQFSHRIHRIHGSFWQRIFSHRFHRIHGSFWQRIFSHRFHRIHRSFWCRIFSHRIHRIHRSFWRRIFSHGFHGFPQMVWLRYWRRGYGRDAIPSKSVCICVYLWEAFSARRFCVFRVFCGTLSLFALLVLQRQLHQRGSILPRISRISTDG